MERSCKAYSMQKKQKSEKCGWGDNRWGSQSIAGGLEKGAGGNVLFDMAPELQACLRGLENHAQRLASTYCRWYDAAEEIQVGSRVSLDILPSFQPPTRGFIGTCFYTIPLPLQTSCNSFPCRTSVVTKMIQTSDSRTGYRF